MANEISVEMRLKLQKLRQDAANAGKDINAGLASSVKGLKGDSEIAEENRLRRERIARARRNAALDAADAKQAATKAAVNARQAAISAQNQIDADVEAAARRNRARRLLRQRSEERAPQASGGARFPAATLLAGLGLGIPGAGSVAALAQLNPVAAALVVSFRALTFALNGTIAAADRARGLYARTMQSGYGLQLQNKRESLASVLGVGEDDVYRFGYAVQYLGDKLATANKVIADSNPTLTKLSWETGVMKKNFEALKDALATSLAPLIESLTKALSDELGGLAGRLNDSRNKWAAAEAFQQEQAKKIKNFAIERQFSGKEGIEGIRGGSKFVFTIDGKDVTEKFAKQFEEFASGFKAKSQIPEPISFMKQLPASAWERMGLVVGGGGGTNYNKQTAENTKKIAELLAMRIATTGTPMAAAFTNQP